MSAHQMTIRRAAAADLPAIGDIYNYFVATSSCTFDTEPRPADGWHEWLKEHDDRTPAIVAIEAGRVVGWGSLSRWNNRCAYRFSVEDSVYVHKDAHGRGIGRCVLTELLRVARQHGHHNVIAQIAGDQPISEALHVALGFRKAGCLEKIGHKFDRWIDVGIWQLRLAQGNDAGPARS